ncbi:helix-turn-helix domain-containing protein [Leptospira yasudae]|uniref:helix-turn-helix domain-containing protein n=1 Tax=Leptospira yasudae TaxID=2202201 RepID=UPI001091703B|nr:helix-turn-helix domain-containing protein [Leptospira yasudae]TGM99699.1 XRE family transcriptional regulator [Leptospira yasudae]
MKSKLPENIDKEAVKRFKIALKFLSDTRGLSQRKIAILMGEDQSTISRIANCQLPLTLKFALLFERYTEISANWLVADEGEMLVSYEKSEIFTDDEVVLFSKIKMDKKKLELVKLISETSKENVETLKNLIKNFNR